MRQFAPEKCDAIGNWNVVLISLELPRFSARGCRVGMDFLS